MEKEINILGIETSCDETAAAVVTNSTEVKSSVVASQAELHQKFGGVVPEIASRAHIEKIYPVVKKALDDAGVGKDDIAAVAVANRPGLTISLLVGVTAAKTLAFMWEKPLIAVDHIHAHLQSAIMESGNVELPAVALIVSGGHTNLYEYKNTLKLKLIGRTIDDAAGEAFDKVASILKLPYPGGPSIEKTARDGDAKAIDFPRSMMQKDSLDFSFSGLKTAVLYHCRGQDMKGADRTGEMSGKEIADICASFQSAVVDVLTGKTARAVKKTDAKSVLLGGGVAANGFLRQRIQRMCDENGLNLFVAPKKLCTDNAAMIASLAYYKYKAGQFADMTLEASAKSG